VAAVKRFARSGAAAVLLAATALGVGAGSAGAEGLDVGAVRAVAEDAVPRGPQLDERLRRIRARIQAALVYPPLARLRELEGVAKVRFAIAADGRPQDLSVAGSTGHAILDRAALAAVEAAAPLPWVYGLLEVPVRFEFSARR
jgi:TonB family protein